MSRRARYRLYESLDVSPVDVAVFPDLERPAGLRLLETRTFSSGVVYLGFAAR